MGMLPYILIPYSEMILNVVFKAKHIYILKCSVCVDSQDE